MCVFLSGFYINMKWITNGSCLGAREHKIYLSEVAKTAICIKITSIFILNSLTWATCLPAHSCALVAVGHVITKLLFSSEYQGHQVNELFCREMPLKKDFSLCLVILSFLNRLWYTDGWCFLWEAVLGVPLVDAQGCFALCVEHQARTEQSP